MYTLILKSYLQKNGDLFRTALLGLIVGVMLMTIADAELASAWRERDGVDEAWAWKSTQHSDGYTWQGDTSVNGSIGWNADDIDNLVTFGQVAAEGAVIQWDDAWTGGGLSLDEICCLPELYIGHDSPLSLDQPGISGTVTSGSGNHNITAATVTLNDDTSEWTWSTSSGMDVTGSKPFTAHVRTVVLHEVGHTMGFEHKGNLISNPCDSSSSTGGGKVQTTSATCSLFSGTRLYTNSEDREGMKRKYP